MKKEEYTIGYLINKGSRILESASVENHQGEARFLMSFCTRKSIATLYACLMDELDEVTRMRYMNLIKKRTTHYPLQYLLGYTYFMDWKFICEEKVLIPRADTENLVFCALGMVSPNDKKVLDLCTGSGCIGISFQLSRKRKGLSDEVVLADISDDALRLAQKNADKLGADVEIVKSDLFSAFEDEDGNPARKFDVIMSNPPYIPTNDIKLLIKDVRDYEPRLALDGSKDGLLFYRKIIARAKDFLTEGGMLFLEIGYDQYMDVFDILRANGFKDIRKEKDASNLDRVVAATL